MPWGGTRVNRGGAALPLSPGTHCELDGEAATVCLYQPAEGGFVYWVRINSKPRTEPWRRVKRTEIKAGIELI